MQQDNDLGPEPWLGTDLLRRSKRRSAEPVKIDEQAFAERARASRLNRKAVKGTSVAMPLVRESRGEFDSSALTSHRDLAMSTRR